MSMSKDEKVRQSIGSFVREICTPFEKFQATIYNIEDNLPSLRKQIKEIKDSIQFVCNFNKYSNIGILATVAASLILAPFTFGLTAPVAIGASTAAGTVSLAKNGISSITCNGKYTCARQIVQSNKEECDRAKEYFCVIKTDMKELGNQLIKFFPALETYQSPDELGWNYFYSLATDDREEIQTNEEFYKSLQIFADRVIRQDNTLLDNSAEAYKAYKKMKETVDKIDVLSFLLSGLLTILNLIVSIADALYNAGTQYLQKINELIEQLVEVEKSICKMKEEHITLDKIRKIPTVLV